MAHVGLFQGSVKGSDPRAQFAFAATRLPWPLQPSMQPSKRPLPPRSTVHTCPGSDGRPGSTAHAAPAPNVDGQDAEFSPEQAQRGSSSRIRCLWGGPGAEGRGLDFSRSYSVI